MAKFIALVMYDGELPADYLDRPAPDPAMFGMSAEDNGSRDDPLMRNFPACQLYEPDVAALRALGDRLVIGVGKASGETMAARGARSVAAAVGVRVTEFAGDHGGFLGGEYGQTGEPDAFAADLRAVPDGSARWVAERASRRNGARRVERRLAAWRGTRRGVLRAQRATTSTRASSTSATRAVVTGSRRPASPRRGP